MLENTTMIQMMKEMLPDTLPTKELTPFEYGVLAGQQMMLDKILMHLEVVEPQKNTKDR